MEKTFEAKLDKIPEMIEFVTENAGAMGVHPKRVMHLELAIEEAVANICSYAYAVPPGEVTIRVAREPVVVRIELIDAGIPFDPLGIEEPDIKSEIENRDVGGLGIFLMRRMLDEMHYSRRDGQNVLTLAVRHSEQ